MGKGNRPRKNKRPRPFDNLHEKKLKEHNQINELFKRRALRGLHPAPVVELDKEQQDVG